MTHRKKFERLIEALMTAPTLQAAAQASGLSRSTVTRLLKDEDFQTQLREARERALGYALTRLSHLTAKAVLVIEEAMDETKIVRKGRFLAAKSVLALAIGARQVEIENRVAQLERAMEQELQETCP